VTTALYSDSRILFDTNSRPKTTDKPRIRPITNAGAGYLAPPTVVVAGHPDVKIEATIEFTQDLQTNGRLASLTVAE
jgi:hypothetical protein